jgi:RNA polymerase sigma-70 factor (ECF subfamily)
MQVVENEETGEDKVLAANTGFAGVLRRAGREESDASGEVVRLFDELRVGLFRFLRWQGSTAEEADDAIQEAFLRLHAHLQRGGSRENLRAWVFRVAGNLMRDERKSGHRRFNQPMKSAVDAREGWADPGAGPEQMALARETAQRLHAAIGRLPALERECLALRSAGFRYREIGGILGIGTSTAADVLRRAMETLARELP